MSTTYVLEVHPYKKKRKPFGSGYEAYSTYWRFKGEESLVRARAAYLKRKGYKTVFYPEKYIRSNIYRALYFRTHKPDAGGKYHCVYCGKRLKASQVTVDHIIPVSAVKYDRHLQRRVDYSGMNSAENLVASCFKCNSKKRSSTARKWRFKAAIGKHRWVFVLRNIFFIFLAAAAAVLVCSLFNIDIIGIYEKIRTWIMALFQML